MTHEMAKRRHLARDAVIDTLVCIEQHQYADAFVLSAIALLHLSYVADDRDVDRRLQLLREL